jgi:Mg-chelatase subunit ChlD
VLDRGDQDLRLWDVTEELRSTTWRIDLDGVAGTLTTLQVFGISSAPGVEPIVVERTPVITLDAPFSGDGTAALDEVLLPPGRYLIGIARSGIPGGGEPADGSYRYAISPAAPAPALDVEPNDDQESGTLVADEFSTNGDLAGSKDVYAWTVGPSAERWLVELLVPLGETGTLTLTDATGATLVQASDQGTVAAYDLALEPGRYALEVGPRSDDGRPYRLRATRLPPEWDAEPNDSIDLAGSLADGALVRGRLVGRDDRDDYVLVVPPGARVLRSARLLWRGDVERQLCLLDAAGADVFCRRGTGGLSLDDLALPPGRHAFEVRGQPDPDDPYVLRLDTTSAAVPDFEAEPNEDVDQASLVDPELGMRGRGGDGDIDTFRLHTDGQPQLWRVEATGPAIKRLSLIRASGRSAADAAIEGDRDVAVLDDLYLAPGDHWFSLTTEPGDYELTLTPLGPPSPDGEHEPNDGALLSERYRIGSTRTGRLPTAIDRDVFRFTLAAPQHIAIGLQPPPDGAVALRLRSGDETIGELRDGAIGAPMTYDVVLEPGDYLLELQAEAPGPGTYMLTSERLDPFRVAADQEPNDGPAWARPLPPSLAWSGHSIDRSDEDWYRIDALSGTDPLRIVLDGERPRARLSIAGSFVNLTSADDGSLVALDAPLGVPIELGLSADGDYSVEVSGGGLTAAREPDDLPVELASRFETTAVAAYWPEAQRLRGTLEVTNGASEALDVTLDAITSHYLWAAELEPDAVRLEPGATMSLPLTVEVQPDAWADEPVQVTVRATASDGRWTSSSAMLTASPDAPAREAHVASPLPVALLGGVNAAAAALGAEPGGTLDATREAQLFDGVTPDGGGLVSQIDGLPLELIVDLAGDEPVPVAGTIIDPQAGSGRLREIPRDFELLLSPDGSTWTPALSGTISPLPIDQAFTLPAPIEARQAMLRITSAHTDRPGSIALGEWKVVLAPGVMPQAAELDIGSGAMGGHAVWLRPQGSSDDPARSIFDATLDRQTLALNDDRAFDLVVGFQDGRSARLERLEWQDPTGTRPAERLERVDVSVARDGPLGPWTPRGTWELTRAADGSVPAFALDDGDWTRYVRLQAAVPADMRSLEMPGRLSVIEHPTDDAYRSVIGEWGYRSRSGPFEWLALAGEAAPSESVVDAPGDAADTRDTATPLAAGTTYADRVEIGIDEDWFGFTTPATDDTIELVVDGGPSVRVALELFDAEGAQRPLAFRPEPDGSVVYQAAVEPGARYALRVHQPPFSAIFTFDTSGSMSAFLDTVVEGIRSFAADVRPGRETVMITPFEQAPLLPGWEDDAYLLQDAVNRYPFDGSSSGAEVGLLDASQRLAEREGGRAVLLVTDAETSTFPRTAELWQELARVRPIIYAVHVGAQTEPVASRELMQEWAASGGGTYVYPTTHGEMDRSFDRMATQLRRPADYRLSYTTLDLPPSSLAVAAPSDGTLRALAPGVGVELIIDTSGSMRKRIDGRRRIDIARESLEQLVGSSLADGTPVAVRTFGGTGKKAAARCKSQLIRPLGALDRADMLDLVARLDAPKHVSTPIAAALAAVAHDLADVSGTRSVVLLTDGKESCGGDPAAVIGELRASGVDVSLNIIGFALDDEGLKAEMAVWAETADGAYFDAASADDLASALASALRAPFRAYGPDGAVFEGGTVGSSPITIDPGTYRVEVLTDPLVTFDEVVIGAGEAVRLELPPAD